MSAADRIKQKREELGMTQDELAHKLGYKNRSSVNKVENSRDLSLKKVMEYAKALECDPAWLMGWDDTPLSFEYTPEEEEQELLALWRNASDHIKDSVMILLKSEL